MEYEKCYVFQPETARPAKKRKTEDRGLHASWQLRKKAYEHAWQAQQSHIDVCILPTQIDFFVVADIGRMHLQAYTPKQWTR